MQYDLYSIRKKLGLSQQAFADAAGMCLCNYVKYEAQGVIPCKYVYNLWRNIKKFPIPDDFFHYTSFSLQINMIRYKMNQTDVANAFGTTQQTISKYYTAPEPILMYELKDKFLACFPKMIVPCIVENGRKADYTEMISKCNFVSNERRKEFKKYRQENGVTTKQHRAELEKSYYDQRKTVVACAM